MHANELHTDAALVRRLVVSQLAQWASLPIERLASSGTDNALYRLGDGLVVRLPVIASAVGDVETAHTWLPRLAALLPFAIGVPLARGRPGDGFPWPWSVYPWLGRAPPPAGG